MPHRGNQGIVHHDETQSHLRYVVPWNWNDIAERQPGKRPEPQQQYVEDVAALSPAPVRSRGRRLESLLTDWNQAV